MLVTPGLYCSQPLILQPEDAQIELLVRWTLTLTSTFPSIRSHRAILKLHAPLVQETSELQWGRLQNCKSSYQQSKEDLIACSESPSLSESLQHRTDVNEHPEQSPSTIVQILCISKTVIPLWRRRTKALQFGWAKLTRDDGNISNIEGTTMTDCRLFENVRIPQK